METKFCEKCFAKNVKVEEFDFNINFLVNVIDDDNFGKIRYQRTTKPVVKKALENMYHEEKRVICRIGERGKLLPKSARFIVTDTFWM